MSHIVEEGANIGHAILDECSFPMANTIRPFTRIPRLILPEAGALAVSESFIINLTFVSSVRIKLAIGGDRHLLSILSDQIHLGLICGSILRTPTILAGSFQRCYLLINQLALVKYINLCFQGYCILRLFLLDIEVLDLAFL